MSVVQGMLDLAAVGAADTVYDLGCGDGRIVIEAARRGAHGVGVDVDAQLIARARASALSEGFEDLARFSQENLFEVEMREASVVMLFLSSDMNLRLRPKLLADLKPGTRVVAHMYRIGDWEPTETSSAAGPRRDHPIFLWLVGS